MGYFSAENPFEVVFALAGIIILAWLLRKKDSKL